jgi:hypothetical protein
VRRNRDQQLFIFSFGKVDYRKTPDHRLFDKKPDGIRKYGFNEYGFQHGEGSCLSGEIGAADSPGEIPARTQPADSDHNAREFPQMRHNYTCIIVTQNAGQWKGSGPIFKNVFIE